MWRTLKLLLSLLVAALPSRLKVPVYRVAYGYRIGRGVRIGFSPILGVGSCEIGDGVRVGHFNLFYRVGRLELGDHVRIGSLNVVRGGDRVSLGAYASVIRLNVFNSILEQDFEHPVESVLEVGPGAAIAAGHWVDFSARVSVGAHAMLAGRNSSIWTHFRQKGAPVTVGDHCYLGSDSRVAPGTELAPLTIVALGSVLQGFYPLPGTLVGGNPASVVRHLTEEEVRVLTRKTRPDIPDEVVRRTLPAGLPHPAPRGPH